MSQVHRPRRSCLYMPGANERALEKAKTLAADTVIMDLEDAVAPEAKLEWKVESEVFDMYSVFVQECSDVEERKVLQSALSNSDESARKLEQVVADGAFKFSEDSLDEALF